MKYLERIEVISKVNGQKYTLDVSGYQVLDNYVYFYTPNGTKRIKVNDCLTVTFKGKKLSIASEIAGVIVGVSTAYATSGIINSYISNNMPIPTAAGRIFTKFLGAATGVAVQAAIVPSVQKKTAQMIDGYASKISAITEGGKTTSTGGFEDVAIGA